MELMHSKPLISVIVPIYNSEKYLERCITSICNQTYTNLEIILVNDGSKDNSLRICYEFAKNDTRIIIKDISNSGVSNARNIGILAAKGEFIQFLDSDDFMPDNYIEVLYYEMTTHNADMVVCSIKSLNNQLEELNYADAENHVLNLLHPNENVLFNFFDRFLVFGPVNKLFKRNIITDNKILYDTNISYGEDMLLNLEYLKHCKTIRFTNQVYWPYIQDNINSLSKKRSEDKIHVIKKLHNAIANFLIHFSAYNNRFKAILNQRMFDYCYNECFAITNSNDISFLTKRQHLLVLLKDSDLKESYTHINKKKYATWIVFLMKWQMASLFLLINKLTKINLRNTNT
ncbi:glycosyltransferase family 2 protein [Yeosuana sp. AK3]